VLEVAEAQQRIFSAFGPTGVEWVAISAAHGRVLAQSLCALRTQPPAAMSAMDGYAVRAAEVAVGRPMRVIGESSAGHPFSGELTAGNAIRIFTGAVIPCGADAVLIQENTERSGDLIVPSQTVGDGLYVRPAGLDFAEGWQGLPAGRVLCPLAIGLAASMGHAVVPVRRRPRVALIATGDELRWPGTATAAGEIISSNSPALAAMVEAWGGAAADLGIVPDRPEPLRQALEDARHADLIVTTGGASVGELDLVQGVAKDAGMALDFWKIRMRPGKPLMFGRRGQQRFLGLPGNPVSALICARVFAVPLVQALLGRRTDDLARAEETATLTSPLEANGPRRHYMRAVTDRTCKSGLTVAPVASQDSSLLRTLHEADALIVRDINAPAADAGERVRILRLDF